MRYILNLMLIGLLLAQLCVANDESAVQNIQLESPLSGQVLELETHFQWISVGGVSLYQLEIYEEGNTESPILNVSAQSNEVYLSALARQKLTADHNYRWRVVGVDADGNIIAASEYRTLSVEQP